MKATKQKHLTISQAADVTLKICRELRGFRTEREYIERLIFEDRVRLEGGEDNTNLNALLNSIHELSVLQRRALERIEIDSATARKFTANILGNILSSQGKTREEILATIKKIHEAIDQDLDGRESK